MLIWCILFSLNFHPIHLPETSLILFILFQSCLFSVLVKQARCMSSLLLNLWEKNSFVFLHLVKVCLKWTIYWSFLKSWFTFWNKYPINCYIKNKSFCKLVAAFCSWLWYNRNKSCPKIESYGTPPHHIPTPPHLILCRGVKTPPAFQKQLPLHFG